MLKVILIIIGYYTLNNFTTHITYVIMNRQWKKYNFKFFKTNQFFGRKN